MRKHHIIAAIALVASLLAAPAIVCADELGCDEQSSCCSSVTPPLCCGGFSLVVRGGVAPALFTDRGSNWVVIPTDIPSVFAADSADQFSDQFDLPWTVGVEFAYNTSQRGQVFLEYAYTQAGNKLFQSDTNGVMTQQRFSDYKTHSGYLGVRYYFGPWSCLSCCGPLAPYVGFKAGFVWQRELILNLTIDDLFILSAPYAFSQTAVSGGLQLGAEWWFCNCWSLVLQGEFIITQGPRTNRNLVFPTTLPIGSPTNVSVGALGWAVTFPVTLGLRWTF